MPKKWILPGLLMPMLLIAEPDTSQENMLLESGGQALIVRSVAIGDPKAAIAGWFRSEPNAEFEKLTAGTFDGKRSYELSDFFNTSLIFSGAQSDRNGITAFYSPWQDAILLAKTEGDGINRRVVDFAFLTGETFRGEKFQGSLEVVTPKETPLSIALWRAYAATLDHFNALFPIDGVPDLKKWETVDPAVEFSNIRLRAAARTILAKKLMIDGNQSNLANCLMALRVLQNGDESRLQKFFAMPDPVGLRAAMGKIPAAIRRNIEPVFSLVTVDASLFAYLNPGAPRFVFIVSVDKNNKFGLEWFDLNDAAALYRAWEVAK
jgi:hypothetical protein